MGWLNWICPELLLGQRCLFANIPIVPGPIPDVLGVSDGANSQRGLLGVRGAV
jgi:hypothetical protein